MQKMKDLAHLARVAGVWAILSSLAIAEDGRKLLGGIFEVPSSW